MKMSRGGVYLLVLLCFVTVVVPSASVEATGEGWGSRPARVIHQVPVSALPPQYNTCYGTAATIYVRHGGGTSACVMGASSETRLARYRGADSQFAYAIAMGDETEFTKISGFCAGYSWCAYSSQEDTLLLQASISPYRYGHAVMTHFSNSLKHYAIPEPHYEFEYTEPLSLLQAGSRSVATGAVAVSQSGRWAVVEILEYGFVRIDMKDGTYRRIVAPGVRYGLGTDPSFELSVSNDGRLLAVTGWRAGIDVYEIDGGCGDALTEVSTTYFSQGTIPCKQATIDRYALFPGFYSAHMPRFSPNGHTLSAIIATGNGFIRASLSASSSEVPQPLYVALGDSFVSGEGETDDARYVLGTNESKNKCHVSNRSYPYLLHPSLPMDALNASCSGARTIEAAEQLGTLATIGEAQTPSVITVGVGGNDINVMGKLKTCLMPDTCEWALPENRLQTALEIKGIYQKLINLFETIQLTHPQATLVVVGYPKVINDGPTANCRAPVSMLLDQTERRYMNETISYLNTVLAEAARYSGLQFIDVAGAFGNERLCDAQETAMNAIRTGDDFAPIAALDALKIIGAESFHPTPRGHELVAEIVRDTWTRDGIGAFCEECQFKQGNLSPPSYWFEAEGDTTQLISETFIHSDAIGFKDSVHFSFPAGSFMPGSPVTLEVHSKTYKLGTYTAANDGSLVGDFTLPGIEGYHTIHAYGQSMSDLPIDRYQVVYGGQLRKVLPQGPPLSVSEVATMPMRSARGAPRASSANIVSLPSVNTPAAVLGVQGKISPPVAERSPSSLFMWGLIGAVALLTIGILAYTIGRRQV